MTESAKVQVNMAKPIVIFFNVFRCMAIRSYFQMGRGGIKYMSATRMIISPINKKRRSAKRLHIMAAKKSTANKAASINGSTAKFDSDLPRFRKELDIEKNDKNQAANDITGNKKWIKRHSIFCLVITQSNRIGK